MCEEIGNIVRLSLLLLLYLYLLLIDYYYLLIGGILNILLKCPFRSSLF